MIQDLSKGVHDIFVESAKLSLLPVQIAYKLNLPVWKRFVNSVNNSFRVSNNLLDRLKPMEDNGMLKLLKMAGIGDYDLNRIVIDLILAAGDTVSCKLVVQKFYKKSLST